MQIGYSEKHNLLALKNLGNEIITADYGENGTVKAKNQTVFVLKPGMKITVPSSGNITMTLLGFDLPYLWEDEQ